MKNLMELNIVYHNHFSENKLCCLYCFTIHALCGSVLPFDNCMMTRHKHVGYEIEDLAKMLFQDVLQYLQKVEKYK